MVPGFRRISLWFPKTVPSNPPKLPLQCFCSFVPIILWDRFGLPLTFYWFSVGCLNIFVVRFGLTFDFMLIFLRFSLHFRLMHLFIFSFDFPNFSFDSSTFFTHHPTNHTTGGGGGSHSIPPEDPPWQVHPPQPLPQGGESRGPLLLGGGGTGRP